MLKKTLAIATLSLVCLTFLAPISRAAEEDVITDLENMLSTGSEEEVIPATETAVPDTTEIETEVLVEESLEVEPEVVVDEPAVIPAAEAELIVDENVVEEPETEVVVDEPVEAEVVEIESVEAEVIVEESVETEIPATDLVVDETIVDEPVETEIVVEEESIEAAETEITGEAITEIAEPEAEVVTEEAVETVEPEVEVTAEDSIEVVEPETEVVVEEILEATESEDVVVEDSMEMEEIESVEVAMPEAEVETISEELEETIESEVAETEVETTPSWDYGEAGTTETWGADYKTCGTGSMQSPIDLGACEFNSDTTVTLDYATTTFEVVNNGHSLQINYPEGSTATIDDTTYNLVQFHFHTPSEHTVNGKSSAMEIHFVHSNEAGETAVVSAMIEAGEENYDISKIWRNIPAKGESRRSGLAIHPENLLPESMAYAIYSGSLTTPPCTEDVTWVVMEEPITLSSEQIEDFQALYPMNARSTQYDSKATCSSPVEPSPSNDSWFF